MNFLLYMAGRAAGNEHLRPGMAPRRQMLMRQAAAAAALGQFETALALYRELALGSSGGNLVDRLICGQLQLALGCTEEAREHFSAALGDLLEDPDAQGTWAENSPAAGATQMPLAGALDAAELLLRDGLYVRAMDLLRRSRSRLDIVIAAEAGLAAAGPQTASGDGGLRAAIRMGDCLLRLMARVQLAGHVSGALKERHLREDLAPWATRERNAAELLKREYARLTSAARQWPGHVETHLRRGLVAQALGHTRQAVEALDAALHVHPFHVPAAARRAVACAAIGEAEGGRLRRALLVGPETLGLFSRLADLSADPVGFARMAEQFCCGLAEKDRVAARGNLALALAEVGARAQWPQWREPAPAAAQDGARP